MTVKTDRKVNVAELGLAGKVKAAALLGVDLGGIIAALDHEASQGFGKRGFARAVTDKIFAQNIYRTAGRIHFVARSGNGLQRSFFGTGIAVRAVGLIDIVGRQFLGGNR